MYVSKKEVASFQLISLGWKLVEVLCKSLWNEIVSFHVGANLVWNFKKSLLCQIPAAHSLIEFDELDDIAGALLSS